MTDLGMFSIQTYKKFTFTCLETNPLNVTRKILAALWIKHSIL